MDPTMNAPDDMAEPQPDDESAVTESVTQEASAVEAFNLVPDLLSDKKDGAPWLEEEGKRVVERCKLDEDNREPFMKRIANQLKLFTGMLDKLKFPTEGADAPHMPLLLKALLSHWSRTVDQVLPASGAIVHPVPTSFEDSERADRVELHLNWQLRSRIPEYIPGHCDSIMAWLQAGSTFRVGFWDPVRKVPNFEHVPIDYMVLPYACKDSDPLMRKVPRKTWIRHMTRHELEEWAETGYLVGVDELYADGYSARSPYTDPSKVIETVDKVQGVTKPEQMSSDKDLDQARAILVQYYWALLPGIDKIKPVCCWVDRQTKKVLCLTIRQMDDSVDRARFENQQREFEAAQASMQQQQAMAPQAGQSGIPDTLSANGPKEPAPVKTVTLDTIVHYRLFPNPNGIYGLGVGYLLEGPNEFIDKILGDLWVAGKFQNTQSGFISDFAQGNKRGDIQWEPGKFHTIACQPEELDKAIKPFQFGPPSATLMELAKWIHEESSSQTASQDTMSGEQGTSRETATSVQERNANANQVVNLMTRMYLIAFAEEVKIIAHMNSVYMEDVEYFSTVVPSKERPGEMDNKTGISIARADYLEDYDLTFAADARMGSKATRVNEAGSLMDRIAQSPLIKDPQRGPMLLWTGMRNLFKAMERPDFEAAIGQPPMPPPPPQPASQQDENAGFINEAFHPVLPTDPHEDHLMVIDTFKQDPAYAFLSPTGKNMLDKHERAHVAELYKQNQGAIDGSNAGLGQGPQPGGTGGMAGGPGNGQGAPGSFGAHQQPAPSSGGGMPHPGPASPPMGSRLS